MFLSESEGSISMRHDAGRAVSGCNLCFAPFCPLCLISFMAELALKKVKEKVRFTRRGDFVGLSAITNTDVPAHSDHAYSDTI